MNAKERASAAWLVTGMGGPTVVPQSANYEIKQMSGWGFTGVKTAEPPPPPPPPFDAFVYRDFNRLRAGKIY